MTQTTIAVCGVHGSGKSTATSELERHYDSLGKSVYALCEAARDCPYPLGTIRAQRFIWYEHWAQEMKAVESGASVIICDRTVMDNLVYLRDILNQTPSNWGEDSFKFFYPIAKLHMQKYTHVVRLPLNLEYLKAADPIRPKDVEYAMRIDKLFDKYVSPYVNCTEEELWRL